MTDRLKSLLGDLQEIHQSILEELLSIQDAVKNPKVTHSYGTLVDFGFLMREISKLSDEIRKDANARKELIGRKIAFDLLSEDEDQDKIKGDYATGTLDMKMEPRLPEKGTEDYQKLLDHFGIKDNGVAKLSYGGLTEWLTNLAEDGKPLPEFIEQRPVYCISYRRRKEFNNG